MKKKKIPTSEIESQDKARGNLPYPVAPIPSVPIISKDLGAMKIGIQLGDWSSELWSWLHVRRKKNSIFYRRLPTIEKQIRLLIQYTEEYMPEDYKDDFLYHYHSLLAVCLSYTHKKDEALKEFKTAATMWPDNPHLWYDYVRQLIRMDRIPQAVSEINAEENLRLIEDEQDSLAQQIINWALAYPEIASGIRSEIMAYCVWLVSKWAKNGLLVIGEKPPRIRGQKWHLTEILRVLWAGMQHSIPLDELCKREGIDEDTYYRWRKQFFPSEWSGFVSEYS